ncbi:BRCT domain protein [Raphanus sativus]|nr:BRCT domain protein [Raphanus sativus]
MASEKKQRRICRLIESVSELRKNLEPRGSNLVVRVGKPESVLVELAKEIGADAIYAHREVSHDGAFKEGDSIFFCSRSNIRKIRERGGSSKLVEAMEQGLPVVSEAWLIDSN